MTTREQLEAEAEAAWHKEHGHACEYGFGSEQESYCAGCVRAKTVSSEQVEAAAEAYLGSIIWLEDGQFQSMDEKSRSVARYEVRRVLAAAGFYVEEATDD